MRALQILLAHRPAWRLLLALLLLVISYLALSPAPPRTMDSGWDKLNHLAAFAALGIAAGLGARASWRNAARAALALLAYGGLIEMLQTRLPPRQGEWADLLADAIGIAAGLAVVTLARRFTATRRR